MKNLAKYIVVGFLILLCVIYLLSRCTLFLPDEEVKNGEKLSGNVPSVMEIDDEIKQMVSEMSLKEKLYQMFYVTPEQLTGVSEVIQAGETTRTSIEEKPVGGIIYSALNLQNKEQVKELLSKTQGYSKIPMFLGITEEGGRITALGNNSEMTLKNIESMADVSDADQAYEIGLIIGKELKELGFNMNFAPVADVLGEGKENVIGDRSFGNDFNAVSNKVLSLAKGLEENGISATLKHFPGQGYTTGGTDYDYVNTSRTADKIKTEELAPFKKGIEGGADFVMIGHIVVENIDSENPATFSKKIVTNLLKDELGFTGLVISSPMNEGAVLNSHTSADAAKEAVMAGIDIILMPNSLDVAYEALYNAVMDGEISESRIDESVMKILQCKSDKGLL